MISPKEIIKTVRDPNFHKNSTGSNFMIDDSSYEMNDDIDVLWNELKNSYPIGHTFFGKVIKVRQFGIFVELPDYQVIEGYKLSGIIDVVSKSLPIDHSLWPKVGAKVYCRVIWYRKNKEVDLELISDHLL
ncbi:hypothetical protein [Pseudanabaena sp. UWO310]|uniref:hypothetical protein n=1 Tax=Pseudanabaena sp. UWO310 TaxID=2480795 RepID=UPI001160C998|nr:hypothetical protein [Pseudanabaena sp. UWO310]TYQ24541.1 hypothetical protein PseudUWO310_20710 [Pseudanabaena sp. UWO310]